MQRKKTYAGLIIILFIYLTGCKKGDTGTGVQPVKDPRNYTWTLRHNRLPGQLPDTDDRISGEALQMMCMSRDITVAKRGPNVAL